jgi:hypothetical protein
LCLLITTQRDVIVEVPTNNNIDSVINKLGRGTARYQAQHQAHEQPQ